MSALYEPRGRAREYSPLAANHYRGCTHRCVYCYVPTIPPWKFSSTGREEFHAACQPRENIIQQLAADCRRKPGSGQRVLLSFTTDPYQPDDERYSLTRRAIWALHAGGYGVQILTKGGRLTLRDIDLLTERDAYAATLTLLSEQQSLEWEPGAAPPRERVTNLVAFHAAGVPTWASLEPVIDPDASLEIIRETHAVVDLYKIGTLNHHPHAGTIDWRAFAVSAVELCESLGQPYYLKRDLQNWLPHGFERGQYEVDAPPEPAPPQARLF